MSLRFVQEWLARTPTTRPMFRIVMEFDVNVKGDVKGALAGGENAILETVMASHSGVTTDEFTARGRCRMD